MDLSKQTSEVVMRLDNNALESMVKEQLRVQIAAVLAGGAPQLVEKLVKETLDQKCDENGRISNYSSENRHTFLSAVCRNAIKESVVEAINEWKNENKDKIKATFKKYLTKHKDNVLDQFASASADAFARSVMYPHAVSVVVKERE